MKKTNAAYSVRILFCRITLLLFLIFAAGSAVFADEMPSSSPSSSPESSSSTPSSTSDTAAAVGKVIRAITTAGNVSISTNQVLANIRSRAGQLFDEEVVSEDTKRIAKLEGVEYCYYNTSIVDGKVQLSFVVVEKNLIRSIEFTGNKAYKSKSLLNKSTLKVGNYIDDLLVDDAKTKLIDYYHKKGFAFADVTVDSEKIKTGMVLFYVAEGPRVKIKSVKFAGNEKLKSKALKKTLKTKTTSFFIFPAYYTQKKIDTDVAKLREVYDKRGFLNASVEAEPGFNSKKNKAKVVYKIYEGPVFTIDDITLAGNSHFQTPELEAILKNKTALPYSRFRTDADAKRIKAHYNEKGYIDTAVTPTMTYVSENTVAVRFDVNEGQQFRIGKIDITGNHETQDKVVRRMLDEYDFQPGNLYNANIAQGDGTGYLEKLIQRQTLMKSATVTPSGKTPGQRDATVNVLEGQTGSIMLGAGLASDSGVIGQFVYEQRNFNIKDKPKNFKEFITGQAYKGAGQTLRVVLQPGTEVSEYSVSFTEPYLHNKPISLDIVGSSWERDRESYAEQRTKGFVGLEKRYKNKWRRSLGWRLENVDVGDLDPDAPQEVIDDKGSNLLAGMKMGVAKDMTDDRYYPTSGYIFRTDYEQVAGDHTFGILSGSVTKYKSLTEDLAERKTVLATKVFAATTVGDAPVFEKFYAGGSRSIRGFEYRGVSTRGLQTGVANPEKNDPIGSNWLFLANAEVAVPLASDNFSALFFVDSGAIDSGNYRAAVGTGLQIMLPQWFGPVPMRFELAMPVMKDSDDDTQIFSFSVGALF